MKNETPQNIRQAKMERMIATASGGTPDESKYLNIGILIPNNTLAVPISR